MQQLAAGGTVDLGAQFGDAVFVGVLHLRLPRDQPCQDVIAEREIGRGRGRPCAKRYHGADGDPEQYRTDPHLLSGVGDGVTALRGLWMGQMYRSGAAMMMGLSVVMRMVLRGFGILTGTVRHQHSRAGRKHAPVGSIHRATDPLMRMVNFWEMR